MLSFRIKLPVCDWLNYTSLDLIETSNNYLIINTIKLCQFLIYDKIINLWIFKYLIFMNF